MEIKKVWAMYFSPTGGTEKAVRTVSAHVAESLGVPVEIYDFTLPDVRKKEIAFTETDLVFFGTPVIAGRVPNVLLPYLKTVVGGKAYAVPMVSFGNRNFDDALIELRNILEDDGLPAVLLSANILSPENCPQADPTKKTTKSCMNLQKRSWKKSTAAGNTTALLM